MLQKPIVKKILRISGIVLLYLFTFLFVLAGTVYFAIKDICDTATSTRTTFITTILETGQLKFLANIVLSDEEIEEVVRLNSMKTAPGEDINENLIVIGGDIGDVDPDHPGSSVHSVDVDPTKDDPTKEEKDIEIIDIPGLTYKATLMIVKDPSRVSLATIVKEDGSWPELGLTLEEICKANNVLGAINGGLYHSYNNAGGYPYGVCVSNGVVVRNMPWEYPGLVLVGLTNKNILQIIDINGMSATQVSNLIKERGIRDAVCFQEEASVDNNHFVQLIINGQKREVSGSGSGLNPRTAIGQRADGALLLLVTDGRGYNSHVGASAADLIDIMSRYGAVNAANLDGGSSTCMWYNGAYLQNSVTFYYSQSSWRLPCAFVVK